MCIRDRFIGSIVKWMAICSLNSPIQVQISEKNGILKTSATTFFENLKRNKITGKRITSNAMFLIASYFTAYFLENSWWRRGKNGQVILPGLEEETFWVIGTHDNDYNKKCWQDQVKIFLILLNLITTKKWKSINLKFTYKKTVWSHFLWTKWPSGYGDGLLIHWSLLAWVQIPSLLFF